MKAKLGNRIKSNYCKQPRKVSNKMQSVLCLCWKVLEDTPKKDEHCQGRACKAKASLDFLHGAF